jgi:glycosyltransferase involved in cell wall biosynthesis
MNKVDVIIPVHGKPIYFAETLQSIINQPQVENIIVILDRVDKEYLAALQIPKDKIRVFNSKIPGIVSALNLGLEKSKADFIARIDSDDIMFPSRISTQLDFLMSNPDHVCVGSSIELFGNIKKNKIKKYPESHNNIVQHLKFQNSIAHPSVMYRRKNVLDIGGYREVFEGSEDYDLWFRLSNIGKLYNLNAPLTKYRINVGQYSSKFSSYRVELDSLVRLFNLSTIIEAPKDFFNKSISEHQVREYLKIYLGKIKIHEPKLFSELTRAQKFGVILNLNGSAKTNINEYFKLFLLLFRFMINSPLLSIRIIIRKTCK